MLTVKNWCTKLFITLKRSSLYNFCCIWDNNTYLLLRSSMIFVQFLDQDGKFSTSKSDMSTLGGLKRFYWVQYKIEEKNLDKSWFQKWFFSYNCALVWSNIFCIVLHDLSWTFLALCQISFKRLIPKSTNRYTSWVLWTLKAIAGVF